MDELARRRATIAVLLDTVWIGAFVALEPNHVIAAAIGAMFLLLGALAITRRWLGYALSIVRGLAAFVTFIVAAGASIFFLPAGAAGVATVTSFRGAYHRGGISGRRRVRHQRSQRFDEVGSAIIHLTFVGLMMVALAAQHRVAAAFGFALYWIAVTWGTIAVHEAGHAVVALRTGNEVPQVRIGMGLTLFRIGHVSVGAVPFVGHTHWAPNTSTMTSRREAYVALGGPAANLAFALALLSLPFVRHNWVGMLLIATHLLTAFFNLVPFQAHVNGRPLRSDGASALRLLRRDRPQSA